MCASKAFLPPLDVGSGAAPPMSPSFADQLVK
jgi:hypothetical protein